MIEDAGTRIPCTMCGDPGGKFGVFVMDRRLYTTFKATDNIPSGCLDRQYGALCGVCDPSEFRWLARVPRGARAVLHDMVQRNFVDQALADRYLAGHSSHRRQDPAAHMMPSERRLYAVAQTRLLQDLGAFLGKGQGGTRTTGELQAFVEVLAERLRVEAMDAESAMEFARCERSREQADAARREGRHTSVRVVPLRQDGAGGTPDAH